MHIVQRHKAGLLANPFPDVGRRVVAFPKDPVFLERFCHQGEYCVCGSPFSQKDKGFKGLIVGIVLILPKRTQWNVNPDIGQAAVCRKIPANGNDLADRRSLVRVEIQSASEGLLHASEQTPGGGLTHDGGVRAAKSIHRTQKGIKREYLDKIFIDHRSGRFPEKFARPGVLQDAVHIHRPNGLYIRGGVPQGSNLWAGEPEYIGPRLVGMLGRPFEDIHPSPGRKRFVIGHVIPYLSHQQDEYESGYDQTGQLKQNGRDTSDTWG